MNRLILEETGVHQGVDTLTRQQKGEIERGRERERERERGREGER